MADGSEAIFARYSGHETDPDAQDALWSELTRTILADGNVPFDEHWRLYRSVFADRPATAGPPLAWQPDQATVQRSNLDALRRDLGLPDYAAVHRWSVEHRAGFWSRALERIGVKYQRPPRTIMNDQAGPEYVEWLPGAMTNAVAAIDAPDDRPAITFASESDPTPQTWTYGELRRQAARVSHGLRALGLRPHDSVALYMPMTPECVAAYLGIVQAGLAVVSIPDSFSASEVATRLRLGKASAIITVDAMQRGSRRIPMLPKARDAASQEGARIIVIGDEELQGDEVAWHDFLGSGAAYPPAAVTPYHVSNVLFSSGTTGEPKAIPWTHLTPLKAAIDGHFHQDIHAADVVAWPTNIGWMMGPWLIWATFVNGATMALWDGAPTTSKFVEFCARSKVTVLGIVPAIVRAWQNGGIAPGALPDVRVFSSTGEASNAHDALYLMSLSNHRAPIIEYCGGTEIGGGHITGSIVQPASPATFTTPALGMDFVILGEDGAEAAPGEMGEIFLVPPSLGLSQRLLNRDHHETYFEGAPTGPRGEVLRRHGDQVSVLHAGFWAAAGRADDTMNLGGIKVGSVELETAMNGHEAIDETAAVGIPPEGGGADRLVVFAVLASDATVDVDMLRTELQARIKDRLNPLFKIADLQVVEKLPRTASNKVMRRELRAGYAA